ncbi:MAG: hypothetical protein WBA68_12480 [Alteraurantiacibacter sp.]
MKPAVIGAAALATACVGPAPSASPEALEGEWRIAGLNGAALDLPVGLALSIGVDTVRYDSGCGGHAWTYRLDGSAIVTSRTRSPDNDCLARSTFPREVYQVAAAIDAARTVERTPANGVRLSGDGSSVTLFSQ